MKRLLIVDDEPAIARLIQRVAEGCGYCVTVTNSSDAFIEEVINSGADLIVLDLSLPAVDGIELLRFLGASKCRVRILIISGFDARVLETAGRFGKAHGLNIVGTINKPVRVAELRSVFAKLEQAGSE